MSVHLPIAACDRPVDEDALLPISALQHYRFCHRRVALVHVEGLWAENVFTAQGNVLHQKAHDPARGESRPGLKVARGMMLRSHAMMLWGKADVVEFQTGGGSADRSPIGRATVIEYKRGRPKAKQDMAFKIQLCAQAMCLEEMMAGITVEAALYFGQTKKREPVSLDDALRDLTRETARQVHALIQSRLTPAAKYERRKCDRCSMKPLCLPTALRTRVPASAYLARVLQNQSGSDCVAKLWS